MVSRFRLYALLSMAFVVCQSSPALGQSDYDYTVDYEQAAPYASQVGDRDMVDLPTAYTLPRGSFDLNFSVHGGGGLIAATNVGLSEFLTVGFSYGANGVFSQESPEYNPSVEFNIKWRLTQETQALPALAMGFISQGNGLYLKEYHRQMYKPKGFYGVFSKSIGISGYAWELHGGVNYSIEKEENIGKTDRGVNFFGGLTTALRHNLTYAAEFDMALDDNKSGAPFGRGRGYLNMALKWRYVENLQIEFFARDLLSNRRETETFERGLKIVYLEFF